MGVNDQVTTIERWNIVVQPRLKAWLIEQMNKRNLSIRETGKRAKIPHTTILRWLNEDIRVGHKHIESLAVLFGVPVENLYIMGDFIPEKRELRAEHRLLIHIYDLLDEAGKRDLLQCAEQLRDRSPSVSRP